MTKIKELETLRSELIGNIRSYIEDMNALNSIKEMHQYAGKCLNQFEQYDNLSNTIMEMLFEELIEQTQNAPKFSEFKDILKVRNAV